MKMIRHFGLGWAPESRFALVNHLRSKGYSEREMIAANVAVETRSGRAMDRFHARVMFPIIDLRGNVVAFGGRILTNEKPIGYPGLPQEQRSFRDEFCKKRARKRPHHFG